MHENLQRSLKYIVGYCTDIYTPTGTGDNDWDSAAEYDVCACAPVQIQQFRSRFGRYRCQTAIDHVRRICGIEHRKTVVFAGISHDLDEFSVRKLNPR